MRKLLFAAMLAAASVAVAGEFKAGFARVDITPPFGNFMPGYYPDRFVKEVLDPLQINMVAFSDGKTTALVAQYDTEALSDAVADRMRDAIVKATGVERDAIILHASHTHDGGFLAVKTDHGSSVQGDGVPQKTGKLTDLYVDMAVTRSADAAVTAIRDLKPAKLSCGRSEAKRISFGRRYVMKNGKVATNPGTNNPDIVRPAGTAFRRAVWDSLEKIPWGEARCYAQIAASVGRPSGARAAGQAVGENPVLIRIPCHRVLGKDGSLTGFGGGLDLKRALLTLEGIPFRE